MRRGIVLALALSLAAALQLGFAAPASADGGLLDRLGEALTSAGDNPGDSDGSQPNTGLIGALLDTVDAVTAPLSDPDNGALASITQTTRVLVDSLDDTLTGPLVPVTQSILPAAPGAAAATEADAADQASTPPPYRAAVAAAAAVAQAPATPLVQALGETLQTVTQPLLDTVVALGAPDGAPAALTDPSPEQSIAGLLAPALQALNGPRTSLLTLVRTLAQTLIQDAADLAETTVESSVTLVRPLLTPVFEALAPLTGPISADASPISSPAVEAVLPVITRQEPEAGAPLSDGAAVEAAGLPPAGNPVLPATMALYGAAFFAPTGARTTEQQAAAAWQPARSGPAGDAGVTATVAPGSLDAATGSAVAPRARQPLEGGGTLVEHGQSSRVELQLAALTVPVSLLLAGFFLLLAISRARADSWQIRPAGPPI